MKRRIVSHRAVFTVVSVLLILASTGLLFHSLFAQRYALEGGTAAAVAIENGKTQLFQRTVSGALSAYQTFQGVSAGDYDAASPEQKIKIGVYRAVTRILDLLLRTDGAEVDTLTELLAQYGVTRTQDGQGLLESVKFNPTVNDDGRIILPAGAPPTAEALRAFFAGPFLTAVNASIADMDAAIALCPATEGIDREIISKTSLGIVDPTPPNIEVDAGDYVLFRAFLKLLKVFGLASAAYNADVDIREIVALANLDVGPKMFKLLLDRYTGLLTVRDGEGAAQLNQARLTLIGAITDYETASDRIRGDQSKASDADELISVENTDAAAEAFNRGQMAKIKDSLQNNRAVALGGWTETWNFTNELAALQATFEDGFSSGYYTSSSSFGSYATLDYALVNGSDVTLRFTIHSPTYGWCEFHGTFNDDKTQIFSGNFNGWRGSMGNFGGWFNATRTSLDAKTQNINLFPLFGDGSTAAPKALRSMLPQLNEFGYPVAGTMGSALGTAAPDATLGGILLDFSQGQWVRENREFFPPAGPVTIPTVNDGTISVQDGSVGDWATLSPLVDYLYGEAGDPVTDIRSLYLARDATYLYARIDTAGTIPAWPRTYGVTLKQLPADQYELPGDLKVQVQNFGSGWGGALYRVDSLGRMMFVSNLGSTDFQVFGNHVEVKVALAQIGELSGRFIGALTEDPWGGGRDEYTTCLQIQPAGSVTGTLSVPGYDGVGTVYIGVYQYSPNFSTDAEKRLSSKAVFPDGSGTLPATYTIGGLPVGVRVFVSLFWDRDGNGVVSPGDYTNFYQPVTTVSEGNTINLAIGSNDDHTGYPPPRFVTARVQHERSSPGGSWDVLISASLTGPSPEDVTVTVSGPGGEYTLLPGVWIANKLGLIYKTNVSWLPDGDYTFTALDSLGRRDERTVHYAASSSLPSVTAMTPATGSYTETATPTLSWTKPGDGYAYQVWIVDYNNASNGVIWYVSDSLQDTTFTVPAGVLLPNTPYAWFVRLYDSTQEPMNFTMSPVNGFYTGSSATPLAYSSLSIGGRPNPGTPTTSYAYWVDAKVPGVAPWSVKSWQFKRGSTVFASGGQGSLPFFNRTDEAFFEYNFSQTGILPAAGDYLFTMTVNRTGTDETITRNDLYFAFSDVPAVDVTSLAPSSDYYFKTTMPTFSWNPVGGANPYYRLRIFDPRGKIPLYTSGWSQNTSATVPAGGLKAGGTYYWTVMTAPSIDPAYVSVYANTEGNTGNKVLYRFTLNPAQLGDLNGNGEVGLEDAVLVLRILAGSDPTVVFNEDVDVGEDGRIGLAEALYVLQALSGLR